MSTTDVHDWDAHIESTMSKLKEYDDQKTGMLFPLKENGVYQDTRAT